METKLTIKELTFNVVIELKKIGYSYNSICGLRATIRDLLGHVSITTTEIYLRAATELKIAALEATYPEVVTHDIPLWTKDTELLHWLDEFCR